MVTILHLYSTIKEHAHPDSSGNLTSPQWAQWHLHAHWPFKGQSWGSGFKKPSGLKNIFFPLRTRTAQRVKSKHKKPRLVKVDLSRTSFKLKHSKARIRCFYLIVFCIMSQLLVKTFFFSQMNAQMIIRTFSSGNPLARAERTGDCVDAAQSSLFLKLCTKERTW